MRDKQCDKVSEKEMKTFLEYIQVFPKDVSHEGRRSGQKRFFAQRAHVFAPHREVARVDTFQAELPDRPIEPMGYVQL